MGERMHAGLEHVLDVAAGRLDDRGLLPLDEARRIVDAATEFRVGRHFEAGGRHFTESDVLWAALLSLGSADEFAAAAHRLRWIHGPRGLDDNTDPCDRFGADVVRWIATCVRDDGDFRPVPDCAARCLLQAGTPDAWRLAGRIRTVARRKAPAKPLRDEWVRRHPETADACARAAEAADPWARETLGRLADIGYESPAAPAAAGGTSAASVLAELDRGYARFLHMDADGWPFFGPYEHGTCSHAMRLVAGACPGTPAWCIVLQQILGDGADVAGVAEFAWGTGGACGLDILDIERETALGLEPTDEDAECDPDATVEFRGAAGACTISRGDLADPALAPAGADPLEMLATSRLRVWLRAVRDRVWEDAETVVRRRLGDRAFRIVASTDRFHHDDESLPSRQDTYRSLAEAIAHADPARFAPGTPNVWFDDADARARR